VNHLDIVSKLKYAQQSGFMVPRQSSDSNVVDGGNLEDSAVTPLQFSCRETSKDDQFLLGRGQFFSKEDMAEQRLVEEEIADIIDNKPEIKAIV
jgi:hypothetical protein